MKIYLASRYSRRKELCAYRDRLEELGHVVTSRWLNGSHQIADNGKPIGESGEALVEGDAGGNSSEAAAMRLAFAKEDVLDVMDSDLVISFTEPPKSTASRGGRHVEFGLAIGVGKRVWVVGYRENVFHWLSDVKFYASFDDAFEAVERFGEVENEE